MFGLLKDIFPKKDKGAVAQNIPNTRSGGGGVMKVADVFSIPGRGAVLTGVIESGVFAVGDMVFVDDNPEPVQITGVEAFNKNLPSAKAGESAGLLIRDMSSGVVQPGSTVKH